MNFEMAERTKQAKKVTWVGFFVNLFLSVAKVVAGILGKSSAMLADGIHSLSDFVTDLIVVAFVHVSGKDSDHDHRYGHGKFETFATLLISVALIGVGIGIFYSGFSKIIGSFDGRILDKPSTIALYAALVSIASKEWLYRYTAVIGKKIRSQAVVANAWHHRSDALSSIGTAIGISGAIFLGEKWRILDPIAGVVVSFFIVKVAVKLGLPSIKELLESALPSDVENEILSIIESTNGVKAQHRLKTRKVGNAYVVDIHVKLDKDISFVESHDIATDIERRLRSRFGEQTHINIHTEPI